VDSGVVLGDECLSPGGWPAWLGCGQRDWNIAKTGGNIVLTVIGEKTAF